MEFGEGWELEKWMKAKKEQEERAVVGQQRRLSTSLINWGIGFGCSEERDGEESVIMINYQLHKHMWKLIIIIIKKDLYLPYSFELKFVSCVLLWVIVCIDSSSHA